MLLLRRKKRFSLCAMVICFLVVPFSLQAQEKQQQIVPNFKSIGDLPDFHVALSKDHDGPRSLHGQLSTLLQGSMLQILDPRYDLELAMDIMLFRYAGIEGMNPSARGPNIDARKVKIIEMYNQKPFRQTGAGGTPNPLFWGAVSLEHEYQKIREKFYSEILLQSKGAEFFDSPIRYLADKHKFYFNFVKLDNELLKDMISIAKQIKDPVRVKQMWLRYMAIIENAVGLRSLHMDSQTSLTAAIQETLGRDHTILSLRRSLNNYHPSKMDALNYAEDILGIDYNQPLDQITQQARIKDPESKQVVIASVVEQHLDACCHSDRDISQYLKQQGFNIIDQTDEMKKDNPSMPYNRVISAYKNEDWSSFTRLFGYPYDQTMITVYFQNSQLGWVYSHIQRLSE